MFSLALLPACILNTHILQNTSKTFYTFPIIFKLYTYFYAYLLHLQFTIFTLILATLIGQQVNWTENLDIADPENKIK